MSQFVWKNVESILRVIVVQFNVHGYIPVITGTGLTHEGLQKKTMQLNRLTVVSAS